MKQNEYNSLEALIFKINKVEIFIPRIDQELSFIKAKDSANLFLAAFDLITDLKQKGVIIGPANGYTNSSLINYILGITTINPIKPFVSVSSLNEICSSLRS